jgi:orotate phosphoribosyltransferase
LTDELDVLEELERTGAVRRGHFRLSSGRHSDTYVQCALLLCEPSVADAVGEQLAGKVGDVDLVLAPALGALIIGYTVARALDRPMIFAERSEGSMKLRRGFRIQPGSRVLIVEDVVTTGGSAIELAKLVEEAGASVAGFACVVERGSLPGDNQLTSLVRLEARSYEEAECPLCAEGVPIDAPGSRYSAK